MSHPAFPYRIFPLGDAAVTIEYGNIIDEGVNNEVIARFHQLQQTPVPGTIEAIPAYGSLTVYYDVLAVKRSNPAAGNAYEWVKMQLEEKLKTPALLQQEATRMLRVPVCYEAGFAPDLENVASAKNISVADIIECHTSKTYRVYMLGFLPGFPYMGEVDEKITMPRKAQPVTVKAGSVGIAGKQTGIYPLTSPGGWQIIGRTPLRLFDAENGETILLLAGDTVQFYAITKEEFENY